MKTLITSIWPKAKQKNYKDRFQVTIDDIRTMIVSDESRILELKKTTGELKDGMHSACAFLNTEGGWLIFGVTPKSLKIVGQEVTDNTQREIALALAGLEPAVDVHVEYVDVPDYPGNKVIAMHFDGWVWGERPHPCTSASDIFVGRANG